VNEMHRTWTVTDLEFIVLREKLLGRALPWPFSYVGPVRSRIDFLNEKARTWSALQQNWDPDLADVIVRAGDPEARVQIRAWDSRDRFNPAGRLALVGNRCGDRAVVVYGFCGDHFETYDRYRIVECDAQALSSVLADSLPAMQAGSQSRVELISFHSEETTDHWSGRSTLYDDGDNDVDVRNLNWQRARKSTVGTIRVTQGGSKFGRRGIAAKLLFWEDHPDDGRYLIDLTPPTTAIGIDAAGMAARIDQEIDEVLRMAQDESREGIVRASVFDD